MHWRRFKISAIPFNDSKAMEQWILDRWREKDDLLEHHQQTGRFPADPKAIVFEKPSSGSDSDKSMLQPSSFIETEVRPKNPVDFLQMFAPVLAAAFAAKIIIKLINFVIFGRMSDV